MTRPTKTRFIVLGTVLLLCLPVSAIVGGILAFCFLHSYFSKVTVEFRGSNRQEFIQEAKAVGLSRAEKVEVQEVRNTDLVEIGVYDKDPQEAARRANTIAIDLMEKRRMDDENRITQELRGLEKQRMDEEHRNDQEELHRAFTPHRHLFKIWAKAEPSRFPALTSTFPMMMTGMGVGSLLALPGLVILVIGLVAKTEKVQSIRQVA